jgi:hypothetical protein
VKGPLYSPKFELFVALRANACKLFFACRRSGFPDIVPLFLSWVLLLNQKGFGMLGYN